MRVHVDACVPASARVLTFMLSVCSRAHTCIHVTVIKVQIYSVHSHLLRGAQMPGLAVLPRNVLRSALIVSGG